jgi:hypothetical protein
MSKNKKAAVSIIIDTAAFLLKKKILSTLVSTFIHVIQLWKLAFDAVKIC